MGLAAAWFSAWLLLEPSCNACWVLYPPKVAISKLVNSLKGASSRVLRNEPPDPAQCTYHKGVLWSPSSFAAACGGAPMSIIRQYIEHQQTPD
jgi:putative transposase